MTNSNQKTRNSSITFKDIKRDNKKNNKLSTYILEHDEESNVNKIIKYYEVFSESRINNLLEELFENVRRDEEKTIGFLTGDENFLPYIHFLIATRMTSLSNQVPRALEEQIPLMNELIDSGLFRRIFDEVLDSVEVEKVLDRVVEYSAVVEKIGETIGEAQGVIENLENKEISQMSNPSYRNVLANPLH